MEDLLEDLERGKDSVMAFTKQAQQPSIRLYWFS